MKSIFRFAPFFLSLAFLISFTSVASASTLAVPSATYPNIQAAVNAAHSGDTIKVAAGTYDAFQINNKAGLTINGAGASTIIAPTTLIDTHTGHKYTTDMLASVFVNDSSNITIKNIEVKDNGEAPGLGGPDALVFWNASSGGINGTTVDGNYTINGDQTGQGIAVDAGLGQTSTLTINNSAISGFQKNGLDIEDGNSKTSGNAGTISVDLESTTVTGASASPIATIAQNGVVAWNEGGGTVDLKVKGDAFSNLEYSNPSDLTDSAAAILGFGNATINPVSNTTFTDTQYYIESASSGTSIDATNGNTFDSVSPSAAVTTGAQLATIENKMDGLIETSGVDPIFILPKTFIITPTNRGIQAGLNAAVSGDTVFVTPGTYSGSANTINITTSNIKLIGDSKAGVIVNQTAGTPFGDGITITDATDVTIRKMSFTTPVGAPTAYALHAYQGGDLTLGDLSFTGPGETGKSSFNSGVGGVDINSVDGVTIKNVSASNYSKNGFSFTSQYSSSDPVTQNVVLSNITSSGNAWDGVAFYTEGGAGGVGDINGVTFNGTGTSSITNNLQAGIFFEGDSDAHFATDATPAYMVTGPSRATIDLGNTAFSGNSYDVVNYQTAPVTALNATFDLGAITGNKMIPAQITTENGKIIDQLDHANLGLVTYYTPYTTAPSVPILLTPPNGSATTTNDFYFTWNASTDAPRGGPITYEYLASMNPAMDGNGMLTTNTWDSVTNGNETLTVPQILSQGAPDGTWYWEVRAEDAWGNESAWSPAWNVTIAQVVTDAATNISVSDATLNGQIGDADATGHSFWVSTSQFPTTSSSIPSGVYSTPDMGTIGAGTPFSAQLSSLTGDGVPSNMPTIQPNTTYYYVAWANVGGTWYPGQELSFTTSSGVASPFVTTNDATNVSTTDATLNATLGNSDADQESFWVSTNPINTSSSNIPSGVYSSQVLPAVSAGGTFLASLAAIAANSIPSGMPAITPSTKYYYVAWAHVGGNWYPGADLSTTTSAAPVVTPPTTYTVTIVKYLNSALANTTSANNTAFPMSATWNNLGADSGTAGYTLSPTPLNSSNAYEAVTENMNPGSSYSTNEVIGSTVGNSCADGAPYAISGYSTSDVSNGDAADGPAISSTTPSFTNLQSNEYVDVWNVTCAAAVTPVTLAAPTPTSPANGATLTTAALTDVDWSSVSDANGGITYTYEVSHSNATNTDGSFTTPINIGTAGTGLTDTKINTPNTTDGTYFWHVMATDSANVTSPWSTTSSFTIDNTTDGGGGGSSETTHTITASADSNGTIAPSGADVVTDGTDATFTITPNSGFHIADVLVDGTSQGATSSFTFTANNADHTIAASFAANAPADTTPPVIHLIGNSVIYIPFNTTYSDQGVTVTDNVDNNLGFGSSLDGGATTTSPALISIAATTTEGTHTILYGAKDSAGNEAAPVTRTVIIDGTPPTATLTSTSTSPTTDNPIHVTATFSEPIQSFDQGDLSESSAGISNFASTTNPLIYTFDVTPTGSSVEVSIAEHKYQDLAGNENTASSTFDIIYSPLLPPAPTPPAPAVVTTSSGSSGGNGLTAGPLSFGFKTSGIGGLVLGTSTEAADDTALPAGCSALLTQYMGLGKKNDPAQVKLLQTFLNGNLGTTLPVTGFFGQMTYSTVKQFQLKYKNQILDPWGIKDPTGYVYKFTEYEINLLSCSTLNAPVPTIN